MQVSFTILMLPPMSSFSILTTWIKIKVIVTYKLFTIHFIRLYILTIFPPSCPPFILMKNSTKCVYFSNTITSSDCTCLLSTKSILEPPSLLSELQDEIQVMVYGYIVQVMFDRFQVFLKGHSFIKKSITLSSYKKIIYSYQM